MQKIKFSFLSFLIMFGTLTGCRSFDYVLPSQNQEINDMEIKPVLNFNKGSFYDSKKCPYNYSYLLRGEKGETKNYSLDISCNNTADVVPSFPLGLPFVLLNVFSLGIIPAVHKNEATLSGMLRYKDEPVKYYTANQTDHEASTIFYGYRFFDAGNMAKAESNEKAFFDLMKQIANDTDYIKEEAEKIDKKVKERKEKEKKEAAKRKEKAEKEERERKEKLVKKYGEYTAGVILRHKFYIGMSEDALIESLGRPNDINVSVGSWGTHKQYIYGGYDGTYIYVENGKVTSYQK